MVTIANVSELADHHSHLTRGSRLAHADIPFNFTVGGAATFNVDDWTNQREPVATRLTNALTAQVTIPTALARETVTAWSTDDSLAVSFLNTVYFGLAQAANWRDPGAGPATHAIALKVGEPAGNDEKALFMLLVASAIAIHYRVSTMSTLNVDSCPVHYLAGHVPMNETVQFNWPKVMKEMRRAAKQRILSNQVPPQYNDPGYIVLDTLIYDILEDYVKGGFTKLMQRNILRRGHGGNSYDLVNTANTYLGASFGPISTGKANSIKTALNHARFVLYMEWRLGWELTHGQLAPA